MRRAGRLGWAPQGGAIADFAEAYADQNERDYRAFVAAIESGRIATTAE